MELKKKLQKNIHIKTWNLNSWFGCIFLFVCLFVSFTVCDFTEVFQLI